MNNSLPRTSGIYVISNIKNGKVYIGKGIDISSRWSKHRTALRGNYHHNCHLQYAWLKYGEKSFKVFVLEHCSAEQLDEREKYHIAIYKARGICYNQTDGGDGMLGCIPSAEARANMSKAQRGHITTEAAKEKIRAANKGKKMSQEAIEKTRTANSDKWIVTNPNGESMEIINLALFCRENNLRDSAMSEVASGKHSHHHGWKARRIK